MNNIRKLTDSLFWVGVNDRRIALFENVYPVPTGMSYNSYVLLDEKRRLHVQNPADNIKDHRIIHGIAPL